ncbi:hypothetical protein O181_003024 [Austropuccinia psidii MF-1]|uniref:RNase III domain-containing protein n=1 Tax=Austropuccinia psidii MF-1 TaxID=1389203 RepID=A0A9Q3BDJ9_9BASI|nr:hypothetical protein [Austropuccinia psidii MF-1]
MLKKSRIPILHFKSSNQSPSKSKTLVFTSNNNSIEVNEDNSISILNQIQPFLYNKHLQSTQNQNQNQNQTKPIFQINYSFETITKPNQNPSFLATLSLPPIDPYLPLGSNSFTTHEPLTSKREAKKLVALLACQELATLNLPSCLQNQSDQNHELIQSQHLQSTSNQDHLNQSQTKSPQIDSSENNDLNIIPELSKLSDLPEIVQLTSPNIFGHPNHSNQSYLHKVTFHLPPPQPQSYSIGLITSNKLHPQSIPTDRSINSQRLSYTLQKGLLLNWSDDQRKEYLAQLDHFTKLVIQISICRKKFQGDLIYFLAPLTSDGLLDYNLLKQPLLPLTDPKDQLLPPPTHQILVSSLRSLHFRLFKFSHFDDDLTLQSEVPSTISNSLPLARFFKHLTKFTSLGHFFSVIHQIPHKQQTSSTLVVLNSIFKLQDDVIQVLRSDHNQDDSIQDNNPYQVILPHTSLEISQISLEFWRVAAYLPFLIRDLIHYEYSHRVSEQFKCASLSLNLVIEALTPPGRRISPDYQTLETIGDSFLKLATTVHLYLSQHESSEGTLSALRSKTTDNIFLRRKLFDSQIAIYILSNTFRTGDAFSPMHIDDGSFSEDGQFQIKLARKVLSDVAEALLGAAYVSGGVLDGLKVGTYLGLYFGGFEAWENRISDLPLLESNGELIQSEGWIHLQETIGYSFRNLKFLSRALTHRSMVTKYEDCYERQEWIGDALLDLWTIDKLHRLLSPLTSAELTLMRASLVSNGTLGFLALRKLSLQSLIVHRSDGLPNQIHDAIEDFSQFDTIASFFNNLINAFIASDPPKVLGDVVEAIIGGVFIDSGLSIVTVFRVLDRIYGDALGQLGRCEPRDPISMLQLLRGSSGCKQILSQWRDLKAKDQENSQVEEAESSCELSNVKKRGTNQECWISFHGQKVGGCLHKGSKFLAEQRASLEALEELEALIKTQKELVIEGEENGWQACDCLRFRIEKHKNELNTCSEEAIQTKVTTQVDAESEKRGLLDNIKVEDILEMEIEKGLIRGNLQELAEFVDQGESDREVEEGLVLKKKRKLAR